MGKATVCKTVALKGFAVRILLPPHDIGQRMPDVHSVWAHIAQQAGTVWTTGVTSWNLVVGSVFFLPLGPVTARLE